MIKGIRHTGIVVHNLEKMEKFYKGLGFKEKSRAMEEGDFIEQVVGISYVKVEWIKMSSPDGYLLELLQYHSNPQELNREKTKSNDLGCSHLAFTINNIKQTCEYIINAGGSTLNVPATSPDGKVKVTYCYDPEGGLIELVEEIS